VVVLVNLTVAPVPRTEAFRLGAAETAVSVDAEYLATGVAPVRAFEAKEPTTKNLAF
jgi:hypothetical protein